MEQKEGQGVIFKNSKTKETQPDYTGKAMIHGKMVDVALWVKEGQKGKFFSVSIKDKEPKPEAKTGSEDGLPF